VVRQITTHASGCPKAACHAQCVDVHFLCRRAVIRIDGAANLPTQEAILLNSAELARYGRPIPLLLFT
jgi:hypothetical protein